jgi:acyl carrier protein
MLPVAYRVLDEMPLTPSGKIDRKALPEKDSRPTDTGAEYVAPQTELEKNISTIWREVLGAERVGLYDNFFDLGGHSLAMAEIFSRLQKVIDREVSLVELFEYPTVSALAKFLNRGKGEKSTFRPPAQTAEKLKDGKSRLRQQFRQRQMSMKKT